MRRIDAWKQFYACFHSRAHTIIDAYFPYNSIGNKIFFSHPLSHLLILPSLLLWSHSLYWKTYQNSLQPKVIIVFCLDPHPLLLIAAEFEEKHSHQMLSPFFMDLKHSYFESFFIFHRNHNHHKTTTMEKGLISSLIVNLRCKNLAANKEVEKKDWRVDKRLCDSIFEFSLRFVKVPSSVKMVKMANALQNEWKRTERQLLVTGTHTIN